MTTIELLTVIITTFLDIAPCSLVELDRRFRGSYVLPSSFNALMIETVRTSETSVHFNETTRRYIPGYLHTRRRENLKSHLY
jgi:hypothetical protein